MTTPVRESFCVRIDPKNGISHVAIRHFLRWTSRRALISDRVFSSIRPSAMSSNITVYVGLWTDYSEGLFDQATLTLPLRWGNILISVLALLVSLAGGATWRIIAYLLHQTRVQRAGQSDPLRQQVQTLLRNSATPISALVDTFWMKLAWAQTPYPTARTLFPAALAAGCIVVGFGAFSILASTVATRSDTGGHVLVRPGPNCGGWDFNQTAVSFDQTLPVSIEAAKAKVDDAQSSRAYATSFYSIARRPLAETKTVFPVPRLPYNTTTKEPCPFLGARCLSNSNDGTTSTSSDTTIVLDTGILDSHAHLGINAAPRDRSGIRHRMACAPIDVSDMVKPLAADNSGFVRFNISGFANFTEPLTYVADPEPLLTGYSTK